MVAQCLENQNKCRVFIRIARDLRKMTPRPPGVEPPTGRFRCDSPHLHNPGGRGGGGGSVQRPKRLLADAPVRHLEISPYQMEVNGGEGGPTQEEKRLLADSQLAAELDPTPGGGCPCP